ncbi:MAG: EamA family transporter [Verrucomicrobiales bacterium]|nr:EamA family transporter [Verrucomicrobiales bacterium]
MPYYLLLPLASAIIYALGSILIKRALKEGVTMDQSFHLTNFAVGVMFLPLYFFETSAVDWSLLWKPVMMGATFFVGTWLTFVGIKRGDVSLVTPIMGTKVVFVAIGVVLLTREMPSVALWIAAILTTVGILVMGMADMKKGQYLVFTILITLLSAAVFGLCDVLVSWWSPSFGAPSFLATGSLVVGLISGVMWLFQGRPDLKLSWSSGTWAWWGAFCVGLQAMGMGVSLSFFDDATGINVVYASRGLWVIVLVVVFGVALGNSEHRDTGRAFLWRVAGTVLLTAAVIIAVMDRARMISE